MDNASLKLDLNEFKGSFNNPDDAKYIYSDELSFKSNVQLKLRTSYNKKKSRRVDNNVEKEIMVAERKVNMENFDQNISDLHAQSDADNWIENTTAVTGNTSERSESIKEVDQWFDDESHNTLQYHIGLLFSTITVICALLSPLVMVTFPRLGIFSNIFSAMNIQYKLTTLTCSIECKGHLLGLIFKSILLGIGCWAVFLKKREIHLPRLFMFRTGIIILTALCTGAYWLFYVVQLIEGTRPVIIKDWGDYKSLVSYAENLSDMLLFIHYTAVLLIETRHLSPEYYLKVVRSPDGVSKSYPVGSLSIQRTAVWILEKYYTEFPIHNPFLERLPLSRLNKKNQSKSFKFYEVDRSTLKKNDHQSSPHKSDHMSSRLAQLKDTSHNERFYEEYEYERRVRKRKARLITATEEAFAHIRRVNIETKLITNQSILDPVEAAQSVFPSMSRALQKYLRITRQQPRHSVESILNRLAHCLALDATPNVFLEPFFNPTPVLSNDKERSHSTQHWALVCEGQLPSRLLTNGCEFQLRQGEISLICTVYKLPNFYISEQIALPNSNKFVLKLGSENSN